MDHDVSAIIVFAKRQGAVDIARHMGYHRRLSLERSYRFGRENRTSPLCDLQRLRLGWIVRPSREPTSLPQQVLDAGFPNAVSLPRQRRRFPSVSS